MDTVDSDTRSPAGRRMTIQVSHTPPTTAMSKTYMDSKRIPSAFFAALSK
jgi:hypothetical protein